MMVSAPPCATRSGCEGASNGNRQMPNTVPLRWQDTSRLFPSGIQACPQIPRRSAVNCLTSPPLAGTRYRSSAQKPVTLLNAMVLPSGANFGFQSPHKSAGGDVSFRFSPVCRLEVEGQGMRGARGRIGKRQELAVRRPVDRRTQIRFGEIDQFMRLAAARID